MRKAFIPPALPILLIAALAATAPAELRLPSIFSDHMVLQRGIPLKVWGWASPGAEVSVKAGPAEAVKGSAGEGGRWEVTLPAMKASDKPVAVTVEGDGGKVEIEDVLIGEVWLCSGQSNMAFQVRSCRDAAAEIAAADLPRIRHLQMPRSPSSARVDDRAAEWQVASPETAGNFTAAGYFFARALEARLDVPVGLVNASWGGTRIEPWVPAAGFKGTERLDEIGARVAVATPGTEANAAAADGFIRSVEEWVTGAKAARASGSEIGPLPGYPAEIRPLASLGNPQQQPTTLYNGMVHPVVPFGIKGALWYQGESNHKESEAYVDYMSALIRGWRDAWGLGEFPFYFVQIAPFQYGAEPPEILAEFWECQARAADANKNTEMVVINDIGNLKDIHPKNKQDVGLRLAGVALAETYGVKGLGEVHSPRAVAVKPQKGAMRVEFDRVGEGLRARDDKALTCFEIIDKEGGRFLEATAEIDGKNAVVVRSEEAPNPVGVRFAWNKLATPNLVNSSGLPAGAFRIGDVVEGERLDLHGGGKPVFEETAPGPVRGE